MMKKILALLLALTLVFALAACGDSDAKKDEDKGGTEEPEVAMIKDDSTLPGMSFTAPDGYTAVERMLDKTADGVLTEKNLKFYYEKDAAINLAYAKTEGKKLSDLLSLDGLESVECDGVTFYIKDETSTVMAIAQNDDLFYGVEYARPEGSKDRQPLDDILGSFKFDDSESITDNDDPENLGDISYTLDPSQKVVSTYSDVKEDIEGNLMEKSMTWRFGTDDKNIDSRFLIRVSKNAKLEDVLNKDNTYEDAKVGDIDYKVRKDSDGNVFEYYTQQGDDVYSIKNLGDGSWFNTRSDASYTAFDALIKSVSFQ